MVRLNDHGEIEDDRSVQDKLRAPKPRPTYSFDRGGPPRQPPPARGPNPVIVALLVMTLIGALAGVFVIAASSSDDPVTHEPTVTPVLPTVTPRPPAPTATPPPPTPPPPPPPLSRTKAVTCISGQTNCMLRYTINPPVLTGSTLRIDFTVRLLSPANESVSWQSDVTHNQESKRIGAGPSVYLTAVNSSAIHAELRDAVGLGGNDSTLRANQDYTGSWFFDVRFGPGSGIMLHYPDFPGEPVSLNIPAIR
jgi:hypothetical protein